MKKISELFFVEYGVNLELTNCEIVNDSSDDIDVVNFVARTSQNNGVVAKVKKIEGIVPQKAGTLSCAAGGSVLSTFVQTKPYYSGRDLYVLTPKIEMTLNEKLFYAMCISKNAYRYSYGRQANKTLGDIIIPDLIPDYVNKQKINFEILNTNNKKSLTLKKHELKIYLKDYFSIERGTRLTTADRIHGDIPFVTAGYINSGVTDFVGNQNLKIYENCLTIDMFGNCFYRDYKFACDDNILILYNNFMNKYIYMFISTIISKDSYKYSYGRQYRQKDFNKHYIMIPSINGLPDWKYMEEYIKSLPYGDKI